MAQNKGLALGGLGSPCCCASGPPTTACSPCAIPKANLTCSYTNIVDGNGSFTLVYSGISGTWSASCFNSGSSITSFLLQCTSGLIVFSGTYATGANPCPNPPTATCKNSSSPPFGLVFSAHTCLPSFSLTFKGDDGVTSYCPDLEGVGYTQWVITYP